MMDKDRMVFEAVELIYDADDDGSMDRDILRRRIDVAVRNAWADGITLDALVALARQKLVRN